MVRKEYIDLIDVFPEVEFNEKFNSDYSNRIRGGDWKKRIRVQIKKIICNPNIG